MVHHGAREVTIDIGNAVGTGPAAPSGGHGPSGMRGGLTAVGGRLDVGPDDTGRWRVRATVPRGGVSVRVLLADDQVLIRSGFAVLIGSADDLEVVGEVGDGVQAVTLAHQLRPDVVLMEVRMAGTDGLTATRRITGDPAPTGLQGVVLTTFDADEIVLDALRAGASGFLGKSLEPDELHDAIRIVARREALLTPRATRSPIARFLGQPDHPQAGPAGRGLAAFAAVNDRKPEMVVQAAHGPSNDGIAAQLFLSPFAVKTHVNRAMSKLDVRDRAQLVVLVYQS